LQEVMELNAKEIIKVFSNVDVDKKTKRKKFRPFPYVKETTITSNNGLPLMVRCKKILGARMTEGWQGYFLDGKPASSSKIAIASGFVDK
jgi:hypothetical protein